MSFTGVSVIGDGKAVGHSIDVSTASGYHLLVVNGYLRAKAAAPNRTAIVSLPFMVGGHCWCIKYYPNGETLECADSMSLFLSRVDKNVSETLKVQYGFSFVSELEKQDQAHMRAIMPRNFSGTTPCWGYRDFMKRDALEESKHLKDDCFIIRCDLAVTTTVDLFIKVGGEMFVAHRCVLAARSMVFKAELFGTMKEGKVGSVIHIEDMEAKVFSALLSFIYTDSLPMTEVDTVEKEGDAPEALWLQHLLAAADRYDLQRLKVLCEQKLCEHIDTSSVTTILTLAEQHNSHGLKEVCFEFLKTPANLKPIIAADGLEDITKTCPSLLKELIAKLVS